MTNRYPKLVATIIAAVVVTIAIQSNAKDHSYAAVCGEGRVPCLMGVTLRPMGPEPGLDQPGTSDGESWFMCFSSCEPG